MNMNPAIPPRICKTCGEIHKTLYEQFRCGALGKGFQTNWVDAMRLSPAPGPEVGEIINIHNVYQENPRYRITHAYVELSLFLSYRDEAQRAFYAGWDAFDAALMRMSVKQVADQQDAEVAQLERWLLLDTRSV